SAARNLSWTSRSLIFVSTVGAPYVSPARQGWGFASPPPSAVSAQHSPVTHRFAIPSAVRNLLFSCCPPNYPPQKKIPRRPECHPGEFSFSQEKSTSEPHPSGPWPDADEPPSWP